jgi:hypothetical protein
MSSGECLSARMVITVTRRVIERRRGAFLVLAWGR